MLMARSLAELLRAYDSGKFSQLPCVLLKEEVMPTLVQCLVRTLLSQSIDGSWGCKGPREETAYAILTLASLLTLPSNLFFRPDIVSAIDHGRSFLNKSKISHPENLWIEKVSYGSTYLAEAYVVAALYISTEEANIG